MKAHCPPVGLVLACLLGWLGLQSTGSAQWVTQTIPLERGWTAVHLRVHPWPSACDEVFANLPVLTVSRYNARVLSTQFGTDPTQLWKRPDEWLTWSRPDGESGYVRTLESLVGGTAYLIQATNACVLTLKGRPVVPRIEWVPGQANLVGFHVSPYPELRPTIAEFFRHEPAIDGDPRLDQRLVLQVGPNLELINLTGQTARRKVEPGLAYWIQAQRLSDYAGPLRVTVANPVGLAFGEAVNELSLQVRHVSDTNAPPVTVVLRHAVSETPPPGTPSLAGAVPLLYADRTRSDWAWRAWPTGQSQNWTLAAGEVLTLRVAVNRAAMSAPAATDALWQSLLEITGSSGTFVQVPVAAAYAGGEEPLAPFPYGLWVGEVHLNEASGVRFDVGLEAEAASPPLPTGGSFPLRLILHAGRDGNCRLLSRVVIAAMKDGRSNTVNRLYTDAAQVPAGATILARISSAALGGIRPVGLDGPGFLSVLQGAYVMNYDDPLNPFKHLYHPDHDNRGEGGARLPEGAESFTVTNRVQLTWNVLPDPVLGATLWRPDETVTGTYQHEIGNLRHTPITLRGPFTLKRVSRVGWLE